MSIKNLFLVSFFILLFLLTGQMHVSFSCVRSVFMNKEINEFVSSNIILCLNYVFVLLFRCKSKLIRSRIMNCFENNSLIFLFNYLLVFFFFVYVERVSRNEHFWVHERTRTYKSYKAKWKLNKWMDEQKIDLVR